MSCHTHIQNLRAQSVSPSVCLSLPAPSHSPHPSPYPCPRQSSQISRAGSANCFLIQRVWLSLQPEALETPACLSSLSNAPETVPKCLLYTFIYAAKNPQRQPMFLGDIVTLKVDALRRPGTSELIPRQFGSLWNQA